MLLLTEYIGWNVVIDSCAFSLSLYECWMIVVSICDDELFSYKSVIVHAKLILPLELINKHMQVYMIQMIGLPFIYQSYSLALSPLLFGLFI